MQIHFCCLLGKTGAPSSKHLFIHVFDKTTIDDQGIGPKIEQRSLHCAFIWLPNLKRYLLHFQFSTTQKAERHWEIWSPLIVPFKACYHLGQDKLSQHLDTQPGSPPTKREKFCSLALLPRRAWISSKAALEAE